MRDVDVYAVFVLGKHQIENLSVTTSKKRKRKIKCDNNANLTQIHKLLNLMKVIT